VECPEMKGKEEDQERNLPSDQSTTLHGNKLMEEKADRRGGE